MNVFHGYLGGAGGPILGRGPRVKNHWLRALVSII